MGKYIYLDIDAVEYIGHRFINQQGEVVFLDNVTVKEEYIAVYSPVTYSDLCYYANGMLSIPGGISGLVNLFDVDTGTMTYNAERMQADLDKYGILSYDDVSELMPEELFDAFNGQYLNVMIGKGLTTWEVINNLIERYLPLCV